MRKRVLCSIVSTAMLALPTFTVSAAADISTYESICNYTAQNDTSRVRKSLRTASVRLREIYNDFQCNGMTVLRFAMENNAEDVGTFIAKSVSKRDLENPEPDGQTIMQWVEANGKGETATAAAVKDRLN